MPPRMATFFSHYVPAVCHGFRGFF